jgi:serine/threonine protein kinase/transposase-like protein
MIGTTIDRYVLVEKIGSGGMGDVYKGHHPSLDQYRAIKVLPPHLAQNEELVERFLREARRCAALQHPNIVRLEHVGEQDGIYFMVMDYVEGTSLRQLIDDQTALPVSRGIRIAEQVCRALSYAHEQGLIHRDVKPSNILVDKEDQAVLTDFGIARGMEADEPGLTAAGLTVGTPEYMSPEQVRGDPLDGRSDLYSLGIVLYELFTGELPFAARSKASIKRQQLEKDPDPPRFHNPDLPPALEAVILRALEKNRHARYATAAELAEALAQAMSAGTEERIQPAREGQTRVLSTLASDGIVTQTARFAPGTTATLESGLTTLTVSPADVSPAGWPDGALSQNGSQEAPTVITSNGREARASGGNGRSIRRLFDLQPGRSRILIGVGAVAALLLIFLLLQRLGAGGGERFSAEKGVDPRTAKEYGAVLMHGVPVFIITAPFGELSPAQRAEKTAQRLQEVLAGSGKHPPDPETVQAVINARGETVLIHREKGRTGEPDPEEVVLTVDETTARTYAGVSPATLGLWWRDLLRDQIRLARGRPPVSTYDTRYGKILDRVYQQVEDEKRGQWIASAEIRKALDDLPEAQQTVLDTAWRTVPPERQGKTADVKPAAPGLIALPITSVAASDAERGFPARNAIDGNPETGWLSGHGIRQHGRNRWIQVNLPTGSSVNEIHIQEGRRRRSRYQLHIKTAKVTFSDGSWKRLSRSGTGERLRLVVTPRAARWVKIEIEQGFAHRRPLQSHLFVAEVRVWGS